MSDRFFDSESSTTNNATASTEHHHPERSPLPKRKKRRWFRGYTLLLALFAVQAGVFVLLHLRSSPPPPSSVRTKNDAPFFGGRRGVERERKKKRRRSDDGGERRRPSRQKEEVRGRGAREAVAARRPPGVPPRPPPPRPGRPTAGGGADPIDLPLGPSARERATAVAALVPGGIDAGASLKPCLVDDDGGGGGLSGRCVAGGGGGEIVAHNPLDVPRTWCGLSVGPNEAVRMDAESFAKCGDDADARRAKLFDFVPKLPPYDENDDDSPPPIVLNPRKNSKTQTTSDGEKFAGCDVPCYVEQRGNGLSRIYTVGGTPWSIRYSMEGPQYYPELVIDPEGYKRDHYWAITSFQSEIPLPYFSWAEYNIKSPPVNFDDAIKGASFIARNCGSKNHREDVFKELQKYIRVDSLSSCLTNAKPPKGLTLGQDGSNKVKVMHEYLFYLSFENQSEDDYLTEKLYGSLESGTVPVILGASNAREHVPTPESVIFVDDFPTVAALGAYLNKAAHNRALYESHHAWRFAPDLPEPFKRKFDFTHVHSTCRMCRWSYAKKYGLGWDHPTQTVRETKISREVCVEGHGSGVVVRPFREQFVSSFDDGGGDGADEKETAGGGASCDKTGAYERSVDVGGRSLRRRVSERDGVVDVTLLEKGTAGEDEDEKPIVYRIRTDVRNEPGTCFARGGHETEFRKRTGKGGPASSSLSDATIRSDQLTSLVIQDVESRITILNDRETSMACPRSGIVDVLVHRPGPQRRDEGEKGSRFVERAMRVIVEDSNALHYDDETAFPSHYGKLMTEDFVRPLELFYIDEKKA